MPSPRLDFTCVSGNRAEVLTMETPQEEAIDQTPARAARRRWSVGLPFDARVRRLVGDWGTQKSPALIEEMITTALKIARDEMTVADLKLINRSAKEMRSAAKIFAPFKHLRKVVVFGSARSPPFTRLQNGDRFCVRNGQAGLHADHRRKRRNHGWRAAGGWARAQLCA